MEDNKAMNHPVIIVAATGEMDGIKSITLPRFREYAERCGARLVVYEDMPDEYQHPKYRMFEAGKESAHRVLICDADILIRRNAPNIFETFPDGNYILNEGAFRPADRFNIHRREVCDHAGCDVDWPVEWWSPGVVLMDGEDVRKVYQMPPWDVREKLYTVGGARIVKNMPWINYQIARHGMKVNPLPKQWNHFVNNSCDQGAAFFWHCAGSESAYNLDCKTKIAEKIISHYDYQGVRVHVVIGQDQHKWILGKMYAALKRYAPKGATLTQSDSPIDKRGVINYYVPYRGYRKKSKHALDVVFCTHPEVEDIWDLSRQEADHIICMCKQYMGEGDKYTLIYPGVDNIYHDHRLRIFNPSRMNFSGAHRRRKGAQLWRELCAVPWLHCICSDGKMTDAQIQNEYRACDAVVSTAEMEGGPMSAIEGLLLGKYCVMPAGVGFIDDLHDANLIKYNAGDIVDLSEKLKALYLDKVNNPSFVWPDCTWRGYADPHWQLFARLADTIEPCEDEAPHHITSGEVLRVCKGNPVCGRMDMTFLEAHAKREIIYVDTPKEADIDISDIVNKPYLVRNRLITQRIKELYDANV